METSEATIGDDWVSLAQARRMTRASPATIRKLIDGRAISIRQIPGGRPRVRLSEVRALIEASTTSAAHQTRP